MFLWDWRPLALTGLTIKTRFAQDIRRISNKFLNNPGQYTLFYSNPLKYAIFLFVVLVSFLYFVVLLNFRNLQDIDIFHVKNISRKSICEISTLGNCGFMFKFKWQTTTLPLNTSLFALVNKRKGNESPLGIPSMKNQPQTNNIWQMFSFLVMFQFEFLFYLLHFV